jgi:hypothetical protein
MGSTLADATPNKKINPTGNSPLWFWIKVSAPAGYLLRYVWKSDTEKKAMKDILEKYRNRLIQHSNSLNTMKIHTRR